MNTARRDEEWLRANRPHDIVRNPAHYTQGRRYEPIDVIEDWELPFHLGNALKYIARAGRKDPTKVREDIKKAIWYLERFGDQLTEEEEAQAADADALLESIAADEQEELEYRTLGEIPSSVLFGVDDISYELKPNNRKDLSKFKDDEIFATYESNGQILGIAKNGKRTVLNDGIPGAAHTDRIYEEIKLFEEWADEDWDLRSW